MSYRFKEIFFTYQGEGAQAGRAAVFARTAGCNLWSGREEDRASAACWFCDTDFLGTDGPGGGTFETATDVGLTLAQHWAAGGGASGPQEPFVVFTGGEPALQLDAALVEACQAQGFEVAIETNGTRELPEGIDWVSPKPGPPCVVRRGNELKLVHPQEVDPGEVAEWDFEYRYLQPRDGRGREEHTRLCVERCIEDPRWTLSLQCHKLMGIP